MGAPSSIPRIVAAAEEGLREDRNLRRLEERIKIDPLIGTNDPESSTAKNSVTSASVSHGEGQHVYIPRKPMGLRNLGEIWRWVPPASSPAGRLKLSVGLMRLNAGQPRSIGLIGGYRNPSAQLGKTIRHHLRGIGTRPRRRAFSTQLQAQAKKLENVLYLEPLPSYSMTRISLSLYEKHGNIMFKPQFIAISSLLAMLPMASSAATIAWSSGLYVNTPSPLKNIMGIDQFDQTGTQVFAVNVNGPAMTMTQSADSPIVFTASSPDLDTSALTSNYGGYFANPGTGNNDIIRTGSYNGANTPQTLTLNNLNIGSSYKVQVLVADGRNGQSGRKVSFDGVDQGTYGFGVNNVTWGDSLLVTGTFVADLASQSFTVKNFNADNSNAGSQVNAVLLHVPEPSGVPLLSLAGLCMVLRRRR